MKEGEKVSKIAWTAVVAWMVAFGAYWCAGWVVSILPGVFSGESGFIATYLTLMVLLPSIGISYLFFLKVQSPEFHERYVRIYFLFLFMLNSLLLIGCVTLNLSVKWVYPVGFAVISTITFHYIQNFMNRQVHGIN